LNNKKVVVVGHPGSAIIMRLKNEKSFVFINYLPNDKLQLLYENAFCFIYPSLQEGFGIPPLEAMAYGTPVLASAVASITEICGDGVLYFNPYSISEIKNRVMYILNDDDFRQELIQKAEKHRINLFTRQQADLKKLTELIFS
jgi:glycosyltransferase involved in cell wall biosynthesis